MQCLLLSWCCLSVEDIHCGLTALIAQCSRGLAPEVDLQIPLLLSAVTELTLQALHMTLVDDSFLGLNGIREHDFNSTPLSNSQV